GGSIAEQGLSAAFGGEGLVQLHPLREMHGSPIANYQLTGFELAAGLLEDCILSDSRCVQPPKRTGPARTIAQSERYPATAVYQRDIVIDNVAASLRTAADHQGNIAVFRVRQAADAQQ